MGPPRRNPPPSSTQKPPKTINHEPPLSPIFHQSPVPLKQPNFSGMTPASRYQHNLKVLRRRDPSIVSIFDQFSYVCVYHHNGKRWEKQGYEGSMFLYERESYPPYGFYILNRMGSDDYIQRLYPEDYTNLSGQFFIIRAYPEFTDRRLATVRASQRNGVAPDKYSDIYAVPTVDQMTSAEKGEAKTIGLWMHPASHAKEPLFDILTRLHSYIKKNLPYPEEFRHGPDRPPPSMPSSGSSVPHTPTYASYPEQGPGHFQANHPSQVHTNGSSPELDKLFAKIDPSPDYSPTELSTSTSKMTVESILAELMASSPHSATFSSPFSPPQTSSTSTSTGISLLDSIFASAETSSSPPPTTQPQPSTSTSTSTGPMTIYTPAPTTNNLPQILDQNVITSLLGFPPLRTPSAASTVYSVGAHSHSSSREGDNEDDSDTSNSYSNLLSDGYSESSTVLDPDAEEDEELQAAGASAGRPLLAEPNGYHPHSHSHNRRENGHGHGHGLVHGDMTPRAPLNGFITPPFVPSFVSTSSRPSRHASVPLDHSTSTSTVVGASRTHSQSVPNPTQQPPSEDTPRRAADGGSAERLLVPFEPESELWPYPRTHVNDTAVDEILELDFADTSALSDPDAFQRATKRNAAAVSTLTSAPAPAPAAAEVFENGHNHRNVNCSSPSGGEKNPKNRRRKGRKEREREEIENSWDVPGAGAGRRRHDSAHVYEEVRPPSTASPSPCPSPEHPSVPAPTAFVSREAPPKISKLNIGHGVAVNGNGIVSLKGKAKAKYPALEQGKVVVGEAVKDSLISTLLGKDLQASLGRNDFVREVLTLIHTDKAFVDTLYHEYITRVG